MDFEDGFESFKNITNLPSLPHFSQETIKIEQGEDVSKWLYICSKLVTLKQLLCMFSQGKRGMEEPNKLSSTVEETIVSYNRKMNCTFGILRDAISHIYNIENRQPDDMTNNTQLTNVDLMTVDNLLQTLSFLADMVLITPTLFPEQILLLTDANNVSVLELSKQQICCILANAFYCTFDVSGFNQDYSRINFEPLFDDHLNSIPGWRKRLRQAKVEKLNCILNYFHKMRLRDESPESDDTSLVVFERRSLHKTQVPYWENAADHFCDLTVLSNELIEDCSDSLQVEFANKFIGGGTLGNGAAMEEIKFSCCPELIAAQLYTKRLGCLDSLLVHNYEQFSYYSGYASTFKFTGKCNDRSKNNHVCAIDAFQFPRNSYVMQLEKKWVDRELNKCYSAFRSSETPLQKYDCTRITSGKWGCGVFNGDPLLKCLIQWMAASFCKKPLTICTYGDEKLSQELMELKRLVSFSPSPCTIGDIYSIVIRYGETNRVNELSLVDYLSSSIMTTKGHCINSNSETVNCNNTTKVLDTPSEDVVQNRPMNDLMIYLKQRLFSILQIIWFYCRTSVVRWFNRF